MPHTDYEMDELRRAKWGSTPPAPAIKFANSYVPQPTYERGLHNQGTQAMIAALKHRDRQLARLGRLLNTEAWGSTTTSALACTDLQAFRAQAKTILSSKRCLQAGMWRANCRRRYSARVSVQAILIASHRINVLKNLDELVMLHHVPKSGGKGMRPILDFGPVARGAQDLAASILRMTYSPKYFQYDGLGCGAKIQKALDLITEGYRHCAEIDIVNFYPSFEPHVLEEALPFLPKEAVAQIAVAASAQLVTSNGSLPLSPNAHLGIPQGSALSNEIAKWSVACMPAFEVGDVVIINHVDNFYLFARDFKSLEAASKTLRAAIRGCPGGHFKGKQKQLCHAPAGLDMLGCELLEEGGTLIAQLSDANLRKLSKKFRSLKNKVSTAFDLSKKTKQELHRFLAVVELVHMKALVTAWSQTFAVCSCGHIWKVVTEDIRREASAMIKLNSVKSEELEKARNFAGTVRIDDYWF